MGPHEVVRDVIDILPVPTKGSEQNIYRRDLGKLGLDSTIEPLPPLLDAWQRPQPWYGLICDLAASAFGVCPANTSAGPFTLGRAMFFGQLSSAFCLSPLPLCLAANVKPPAVAAASTPSRWSNSYSS